LAGVRPRERASVSRALNTLRRHGLLEVQRQVRDGRSVAIWRLAAEAWRQAERLRQQRAGAARRENGRRRQQQREERAKARREAYEAARAKLRAEAPRKSTERLENLLGMLGSAHAGERATAASKIEQERRRFGLTWAELVGDRKPRHSKT
jgi:DNA-binding PadR family transcriptional regulator